MRLHACIIVILCFSFFSRTNGLFSWKTCEDYPKNTPLQVRSVSFSPDPIKINDWSFVDADFLISRNFTAPLKLSLSIHKIVNVFWLWTSEIRVPCVTMGDFNIGSCTYDVCSMASIMESLHGCPDEFTANGVPCTCPLRPGEYRTSAGPLRIYLDTSDFPGILNSFLSGNYRTVVTLTDGLGDAGCFEYKISITSG